MQLYLALSGLSTIFYSMEQKYAHTIWHLFVSGSLSSFLYYIDPLGI